MNEEIWLSPENFSKYAVSNYGKIRITSTKRVLPDFINKEGYNRRVLRPDEGKPYNARIHRMVALLFVSNPNPELYKQVNHIDGNKLNNHYLNLEWTSSLGNVTHAIDNGLRKHSSQQKLTIEDVRFIREQYNNTNLSMSDLGKTYGVHPDNIKALLRYKTYPNVDPDKKSLYKINYLSITEFNEWVRYKGSKKVRENS
jgi:hypothetical protein